MKMENKHVYSFFLSLMNVFRRQFKYTGDILYRGIVKVNDYINICYFATFL